MIKYPDLKKDDINPKEIYQNWIDNPNDKDARLLASAILQPSDLLAPFEKYDGKGSMKNREKATEELDQKKSWILRYSSVYNKEDKYNKAYAISLLKGEGQDVIKEHYLIIHRLGSGFYYGVKNVNRGSKSIPKILEGTFYPSIIELISNVI